MNLKQFSSLPWIFITLRAVQIVLAIICLGLSARLVDIANSWGRAIYNLIISLFTLIYLAVLLFGQKIRIIQPITILVCDIVFFIFWLAAFACIANDLSYGCVDNFSAFGYYFHSNICQVMRALTAFGVLIWFTFIATLVLYTIFVLVPSYKIGGFQSWLQKSGFEVNDTRPEFNVQGDVENPPLESGESEGKMEVSSNEHPQENLPEGELPMAPSPDVQNSAAINDEYEPGRRE